MFPTCTFRPLADLARLQSKELRRCICKHKFAERMLCSTGTLRAVEHVVNCVDLVMFIPSQLTS